MSESKSEEDKERLLPSKTSTSTLEDKDEDKDETNGRNLVIAFALMLFFQLGNRIFGKLYTYPMYNYPLFMNLVTTVIYLPICFAYIIPIVHYTEGIITKEQINIPKYKFFVMGAFDSLANIMAVFAVNYIPSAGLIVLVQQSAIPISMAISRVLLQARYSYAQYAGALIVCLGIVIVLIPTLTSNDKASSGPNDILWLTMLVLSCVPMCLSSVYKEKALGEVDIDVVYLNGWVSVFQSLVAIPLSIPSAYASGMTIDDIIPNMVIFYTIAGILYILCLNEPRSEGVGV